MAALVNIRTAHPRVAALRALGVLTIVAAGAVLCPAQERAEVQVWAIRATTANSEISPELQPLVDVLKKQFKFTGYKLEKRESGSVALNQPYEAALIGDFRAKVTPVRKDAKNVQLQIEVLQRVRGKDDSKLRTTVTMESGKFQLLGGWRLGKGDDVLIVAVSGK